MFGIEHWGVEPEIMTMAKGVANGMPLGVTIATPEIAECFKKLTISTFGGNPICSAAANATIDFITRQAPPNYLIESFDKMKGEDLLTGTGGENLEYDKLYEDARAIVLSTGSASTTFLQRKLKIGYARAASIMDQLESSGIVGPQEGSKARQVIFDRGDEGNE